jgi:zinc protease
MEAEFARLAGSPAGGAELQARKASLIGAFGRQVETTSGVADQLSRLASFGLPLSRLNTYVSDIETVTPEAVHLAANRYFDPARADLVVVGDADVFLDELRRRRRNAEQIAIGQLNLDRPELR